MSGKRSLATNAGKFAERIGYKIYEFFYLMLSTDDFAEQKLYIRRLRRRGVKIGRDNIIDTTSFFDRRYAGLIEIGDNCYITRGCTILAHDASVKGGILARFSERSRSAGVKIHDNCFIGVNSIVLPGVEIGPNSIVGAGSIVTKNVKPGMVAAGNPAREIKTLERFLRENNCRQCGGLGLRRAGNAGR